MDFPLPPPSHHIHSPRCLKAGQGPQPPSGATHRRPFESPSSLPLCTFAPGLPSPKAVALLAMVLSKLGPVGTPPSALSPLLALSGGGGGGGHPTPSFWLLQHSQAPSLMTSKPKGHISSSPGNPLLACQSSHSKGKAGEFESRSASMWASRVGCQSHFPENHWHLPLHLFWRQWEVEEGRETTSLSLCF